MNRSIALYCRALSRLCAVLLFAIVVLVFGNVVLRYGFNSGIVASEEVSRWLFVWLTFLGAIVALRERAHLGTDMLVSRLGRRGRALCLGLACVAMIYTTWLLLQGSLVQARLNLDVAAPVTGVPVALFYGAGVVFGVSALVILGWDLIRLLAGRLRDEELVAVRESEDLPPSSEDHRPSQAGSTDIKASR
ncbi:TRAP transporter small permease [Xenophilus arseniciresistens]|uniref:TRAP transporter small permease protein n=1 Tax=Xenophilus arseniciresistens TaxID=1283306 RepID=A0AAE3NCL3_9BURK|nr:TRAP transporter small permease [Xenophilus arseniciresistens]MDA7419191.1 TRAP transporter small permease [Xenophilus arseniciresistens]